MISDANVNAALSQLVTLPETPSGGARIVWAHESGTLPIFPCTNPERVS